MSKVARVIQPAAPRLRIKLRWIGIVPETDTYSIIERDDALRLTQSETRRNVTGYLLAKTYTIDGGLRFQVTHEHTGFEAAQIMRQLLQKLLSNADTAHVLTERSQKTGELQQPS